jgi:hypothetical protein
MLAILRPVLILLSRGYLRGRGLETVAGSIRLIARYISVGALLGGGLSLLGRLAEALYPSDT